MDRAAQLKKEKAEREANRAADNGERAEGEFQLIERADAMANYAGTSN